MNEGDLGLPRGRLGYEGDWSKMREPPPNGVCSYVSMDTSRIKCSWLGLSTGGCVLGRVINKRVCPG